MKINVIGTSGSGKSTLSKRIAAKLDIPYIEMDFLFWKPNWVQSSGEEFLDKIEQATSTESWVIDGNYNRTNKIKWKDIDMIVWVDYSFIRTFFQVTKRALARVIDQTELWPNTGNRESFFRLFRRNESIIWWSITTYSKNKKRYASLFNADKPDALSHVKMVRLTSPKEADNFIKQFSDTRINSGG